MSFILSGIRAVYRSFTHGGPFRGIGGLRHLLVRIIHRTPTFIRLTLIETAYPLLRRSTNPVNPGAHSVLLSFGRPYLIRRIVRLQSLSEQITQITVSNNNPEHRDFPFNLENMPRLRALIHQTERKSCFERIIIASGLPDSHFFFQDDDLFLLPSTIDTIIEKSHNSNDSVIGIAGSCVTTCDEQSGTFSTHYIENQPGSVDILHRVYAMTAQQVTRCIQLYNKLRRIDLITADNVSLVEDILISFSGTRKPQIIPHPAYLPHPSGFNSDIAVSARSGFLEIRRTIYQHLIQNREKF